MSYGPFSHTNVFITFKRLVNHVLRTFISKLIVVYFNDIMIYNKSLDEQLNI